MAAIVSGNSLGLELTSLKTLGAQQFTGNALQGRAPQGTYVNAATGNLVVQAVDGFAVGGGPDVQTLRTYNSQGLLDDDNGDNWSSGVFAQPLVVSGALNALGSTIARTSRDGAVAIYTFDSVAVRYVSTQGDGAHDTITYLATQSRLEWRDGSTGLSQRYEASGAYRLLSEVNPDGEKLTYAYAGARLESVLTEAGEGTRYFYDSDLPRANLKEVRTVAAGDVSTGSTQYRYDLENRLVSVIVDHSPGDASVANGDKYETTYTYAAPGSRRIATITEPGGITLAFTYLQDKVKTVTDALGHTTTFTYGSGATAVEDARGGVTRYEYDAAGQVLAITDWDGPTNKVSAYAYDLSGNRLREKTTEGGITYQDNHLGYDSSGRLRDIADARVHMTLWYDAVGNRSRVKTSVNYQGATGEQDYPSDRYYLYDAMNRQTVVGALDALGTSMDAETHKVVYDKNGNRVSDTYLGTRIAVSGTSVAAISGYTDGVADYNPAATYVKTSDRQITERYTYDGLNRLATVERAGVQVDVRRYDAADRVVSSGVSNLPVAYRELLEDAVDAGGLGGISKYVNRFNDNGQLQRQLVLNPDNTAQSDIIWVAGAGFSAGETYRPAGYDGAGNVLGYSVVNRSNGAITTYSTTFERFDSYQAGTTIGVSSSGSYGDGHQVYDTNGFLVQVLDGTKEANNRTFINDAQGRALFVQQGDTVRRQLIVNGEVMGAYGVGLHEFAPSDSDGNPNFVDLADFNFSYSKISGSYPAPSPGMYVVRTGDTLQSVAQGAYGDASLWYLIAQANGLDSPDAMRVGQTLNIPNRVGTTGNSEHVFKPYDPSRITGGTTPNMPMPESGCGGAGQVLMLIVAVAVSFVLGPGVIAGFLSAMASQAVGLMTGTINRLDWKAVAVSTVSAGVAAGVGEAINGVVAGAGQAAVSVETGAVAAASGAQQVSGMAQFWASTPGAVTRAVIGNVITQGISVATGLQAKFDWRSVAASGIGAGVGSAAGPEIGNTFRQAFGEGSGTNFAAAFATSFIAGTAAAVARGGRVAVEQVAADAFGNAVGSSLASAANGDPTRDPTNKFYENELDRQSDNYKQPADDALRVNGLTFSQTKALRQASNNPYGLPTRASGIVVRDVDPESLVSVGEDGSPIADLDQKYRVLLGQGASALPATLIAQDWREQADALGKQSTMLASAAQYARDRGMTAAADDYQQKANAAYYAAFDATIKASDLNAATLGAVSRSLPLASSRGADWSYLGMNSSGIAAVSNAGVPAFTVQIGLGANAGGGLIGGYAESGVAVGLSSARVTLNLYKIEGIVHGPQEGASIGLVGAISEGMPSPGVTRYYGATAFGNVGLGGNVTVLSDPDRNLGIGRASARFSVGEAVGAGAIQLRQTNYDIFNLYQRKR
jgi:YD repeat-containing protein